MRALFALLTGLVLSQALAGCATTPPTAGQLIFRKARRLAMGALFVISLAELLISKTTRMKTDKFLSTNHTAFDT